MVISECSLKFKKIGKRRYGKRDVNILKKMRQIIYELREKTSLHYNIRSARYRKEMGRNKEPTIDYS